MEIVCRIEIEGRGAVEDVVVDARDQALVGELVAALARRYGLGATVRATVGGVELVADVPVSACGLLHGDTIVLGPPGRGAAAGGPAAGGGWTVETVSGATMTGPTPVRPPRAVIGSSPTALVRFTEPGVALSHVLLGPEPDGSVVVTAGAAGVSVDSRVLPAGMSTRLVDAARISLPGGAAVRLAPVPMLRAGGAQRPGQMLVSRPPAPLPPVVDHAEIRVAGAPTGKDDPVPFSWIQALAPMLLAGPMAYLLGSPFFLLFGLMGPVTAVGSWFDNRRGARRRRERDHERWLVKLNGAHQTLVGRREALVAQHAARFPSLREQLPRLETRSGLWWHREGTEDFAAVRVGYGYLAPPTWLRLPEWEADEPDEVGVLRAEDVRPLALPVVVRLGGSVTSVWGNCAREVANTAVAQAAVSCSPAELSLVVVSPHMPWAKWLPHTRVGSGGSWSPGAAAVEALRSLLAGDPARRGQVLVVVDQDAEVPPPLLTELAEAAREPGSGLGLLWVGASGSEVPGDSAVVAEAVDGRVSVCHRDSGRIDEGDADLFVALEAESVARTLAPLSDAGASGASAQIPSLVQLCDLVDVEGPRGVAEAWRMHQPGSLAAPVGVGPEGPVVVDLVCDGPHALVAGTSGAGKSELLQSWISALAASYPPSECTFLFIDYKGGSATEVFAQLPHSVGHVTDLDESTALRSLASLRAEVRRRESMQTSAAPDRDAWARLRDGQAPPSLVIVVDEFATLLREIPEFIDGILDVAQRGRSLGLHLVLATQRPAGAVSDAIMANIGLRISLRTLDVSDSKSVLGAPDAAQIPAAAKGRAVVLRGGELVPVQSGWATAPLSGATSNPVALRTFVGTEPMRSGTTSSAGVSQVSAVVAACALAHEGHRAPRRPWLEPLAEVVSVRDVWAKVPAGHPALADPARWAMLGVADDPASQSQPPALVDLEADGGLICVGVGGSGKTMLLRTTATVAALNAPPERLSLVVADFSSGALAPLRALPHCVMYASGSERETVTRMVLRLEREVVERRDRLVAAGVSEWSELEGADRMWLVFDDLGAFRSEFENIEYGAWVERLRRVAVEGRAVGMHLLASAPRRAVVPQGLWAAVSGRVVLRCADADEYAVLGVSREARGAELVPGRGFLDGTLVQFAALSAAADGRSEAEAVAKVAARAVERVHAVWPPLAEVVRPADVPGGVPPMVGTQAVVAVRDVSGEPAWLDAAENTLVCGGAGSGRTNALVALGLAAAAAGRPLVAYGEVAERLAARGCELVEVDGIAALIDASVPGCTVLVDDAETLVEGLDGERLAQVVADRRVAVVASMDAQAVARAWTGWTSAIRRARQMWWLCPEPGIDLGLRWTVRPGLEMVPGRGLLVVRGRSEVCQALWLG